MDWGTMGQSLWENLSWVCVMFGLFALCVLASMIAEAYYHVRYIGRHWSGAQAVVSLFRMLAIGLSTAVLAVVATVAPMLMGRLNLMDKDFCKLISVTVIIGMYAKAIIKYFKEALAKIDDILANRDVAEELQPVDEEKGQMENTSKQ